MRKKEVKTKKGEKDISYIYKDQDTVQANGRKAHARQRKSGCSRATSVADGQPAATDDATNVADKMSRRPLAPGERRHVTIEHRAKQLSDLKRGNVVTLRGSHKGKVIKERAQIVAPRAKPQLDFDNENGLFFNVGSQSLTAELLRRFDTLGEAKTFFAVCGALKLSGDADITGADIARATGLHKSCVSRALRSLQMPWLDRAIGREREPVMQVGVGGKWVVNPRYVKIGNGGKRDNDWHKASKASAEREERELIRDKIRQRVEKGWTIEEAVWSIAGSDHDAYRYFDFCAGMPDPHKDAALAEMDAEREKAYGSVEPEDIP